MPVASNATGTFFQMKSQLLKQLHDTNSLRISGLRGSSPAWLSGLLSGQQSCCCILPDEHLAPIFEQDLHLFTDKRILWYPGYEIPPYTPLSPDQQTTAARLATLYQLRENPGNKIMVTSILNSPPPLKNRPNFFYFKILAINL